MTHLGSMKMITAPWQNRKSFRLIPVTNTCPYIEGIYDPDSNVLVLLSAVKKETFHFVPKIDDNGDKVKTKFPRANGKIEKEERKTLETFVEFYIQETEEIKEILSEIAVNYDTFNYRKYLKTEEVQVTE